MTRSNFFLIFFIFISQVIYAEKADRAKPIIIDSDEMQVDDAKSISTYIGDVILQQGTLIIKADKLVIREDKQGFQHSTATGKPATFKQKREGVDEYIEGQSLRIEYDGNMDKLHLYSKARVKRGNDLVFGDYIMYDASSEFAQAMSGNTKDANGNPVKKGRTRAIIRSDQ
ncbi:MAG: lipopolysaccharide transport periplasmic protein LptA [Nitrosomonadales bacterium]|jgi:lipopolysaccharide export system protein LptA